MITAEIELELLLHQSQTFKAETYLQYLPTSYKTISSYYTILLQVA